GDEGEVVKAALTPDGTQIALCLHDRPVSVWHTLTGEQVAGFPSLHSRQHMVVSFSSDGAKLVTGSYDARDISLSIWEVSTGAQVGSCTLEDNNFEFMVLSPDGSQIVLGSEFGLVRMFDIPSGRHLCNSLEKYSGGVSEIAFSPNGSKMIMGARDGTIKIWDATQLVPDFNLDSSVVCSVAFNLDGTTVLAVDVTGNLQIYDSISGDLLAGSQEDNEDDVESVAFSADRMTIGVVFYGGRVRIWDGVMAKPLHSVQIEGVHIDSTVFSHDAFKIALSD
ncbi:hypothetical protein GYMLUDRAFT_182873, partial [Collybiopsis luxurians FD-317 M1]